MKPLFPDRESKQAVGDALIFAGCVWWLQTVESVPARLLLLFFGFCSAYGAVQYLNRERTPPTPTITMPPGMSISNHHSALDGRTRLWCPQCTEIWRIDDVRSDPEQPIPKLHCAKCGAVLTLIPPNAFRRDPDYWKESGLAPAKERNPLRRLVRPSELDDPDRR